MDLNRLSSQPKVPTRAERNQKMLKYWREFQDEVEKKKMEEKLKTQQQDEGKKDTKWYIFHQPKMSVST